MKIPKIVKDAFANADNTRVILREDNRQEGEQKMRDFINKACDDCATWPEWEEEGPPCTLCGKEVFIYPEEREFPFKNEVYTVIYKNLIQHHWESKSSHGFLRCVYCFNVFHHKPCTLSLSISTYVNFKVSKTWSCPLCVPEFKPRKAMNFKGSTKCDRTHENWNRFLISFFKKLNHMLQVPKNHDDCYCSPNYSYISCVHVSLSQILLDFGWFIEL